MPTIFDKIIAGEIPCHKVWEDEHHLAFLDINPVCDGHTLVLPKNGVDYIFDLEAENHKALWDASRKVAEKLKEKLKCERVVIAVYGFEVPHAHVHLMPASAISDISFPARSEQAKGDLERMADLLKP